MEVAQETVGVCRARSLCGELFMMANIFSKMRVLFMARASVHVDRSAAEHGRSCRGPENPWQRLGNMLGDVLGDMLTSNCPRRVLIRSWL